MNLIKFNLGCGPDIKPGFINIDTCPQDSRVLQMDIRKLEFEQCSVDYIYTRDVIEHLSLEDTKLSLQNWSKISKNGAKLFIQTVCWDSVLKAYLGRVWNLDTVNYMLFAGKNWVDGISRNEDFHKSTYNQRYLSNLLELNGFTVDKIELDTIDDILFQNPVAHNLNMRLYATRKQRAY